MKKTVRLTEDQRYTLRVTLEQIWDTIGADVLSLEEGKCPSVSRYDVAEMCLDADRWKDSRYKEEMIPIMEILREWGWMSKKFKAEIRIALPYRTYGY